MVAMDEPISGLKIQISLDEVTVSFSPVISYLDSTAEMNSETLHCLLVRRNCKMLIRCQNEGKEI